MACKASKRVREHEHKARDALDIARRHSEASMKGGEQTLKAASVSAESFVKRKGEQLHKTLQRRQKQREKEHHEHLHKREQHEESDKREHRAEHRKKERENSHLRTLRERVQQEKRNAQDRLRQGAAKAAMVAAAAARAAEDAFKTSARHRQKQSWESYSFPRHFIAARKHHGAYIRSDENWAEFRY